MVAGTVTSAAVPGARAWDVVVGDRFIAAVAAPAPDPCLAALATAAADGEVTIESLVGLVPLGGSKPVDSFAFVWWPGGDTSEVTAVVRGDAVVDLTSPGGARRFDSRGIRPWHLAEFGAVVGIRVTAAEAPLGRLGEATEQVLHARASLRASAVEWATVAAPRRPDASAADADTILMPRGRPVAATPTTAPIPTPDADLVGRSPRPLGSGLIAGSADGDRARRPRRDRRGGGAGDARARPAAARVVRGLRDTAPAPTALRARVARIARRVGGARARLPDRRRAGPSGDRPGAHRPAAARPAHPRRTRRIAGARRGAVAARRSCRARTSSCGSRDPASWRPTSGRPTGRSCAARPVRVACAPASRSSWSPAPASTSETIRSSRSSRPRDSPRVTPTRQQAAP